MLAAFGVDVLDPATTPRRIAVLATRLPPWARAPGEPWSVEAELLALLVDHLAQLTYVTLKASGAKSVTRPRPLPRPPRTSRRPAPASPGPGSSPPGKAGNWLQAAQQLAAIPGVITRTDQGGG